MKYQLLNLFLISSCLVTGAEPQKGDGETVFRKPFTLNLKVDEERFYEEKFEKMPFVHSDSVYLFKGDDFGVSLKMKGDEVAGVTYQPDVAKADITFKFSQEVTDGEKPMTLLIIKNGSKERIYMDALMTVPGKQGIFKTTILALDPGLLGYESWPHPIVQLVLKNIRNTEEVEEAKGAGE